MSAFDKPVTSSIHVKDGLLEEMWISNVPSTIAAIADAVVTHTSLTALHIFYSRIFEPEAEVLAPALRQNTTLTAVRLDGNFLLDRGALKIASALASHPKLTRLDLRNCQITSEGISPILTPLSHLSTLQHLSLSHNKCGDESGTKIIGEFLSTNTTIQTLELAGMGMCMLHESPSQLSNLGCRNIFSAFARNSTLTHLNLSINQSLTDDLVLSIEEMCRLKSCRLKKLNLDFCEGISPYKKRAIEHLLKVWIKDRPISP